MFGFGFKKKVKKIIKKEFSCEIDYFHNSFFKYICEQAKNMNQNEYSVAIYYMLIMMNTLIGDERESKSKDFTYTEEFFEKHSNTIKTILHKANSPQTEILKSLNEVYENLNLLKKQKLNKEPRLSNGFFGIGKTIERQ